ncbi:MAG: caspase family protein [Pseudomonadales bacterium]
MKYQILMAMMIAAFIASAGIQAQQARGIAIEPIPGDAGERIALVIGNSEYEADPLRNPSNDAADIADVLAQLGFDVTLLIDADFPTMSRAVSEFGGRASGNNGVALFYFAGHGMQVNGRNFLIPVSANIGGEDEVPYKALDAGMVLSKLESAGSDTNILILDACRNNPFARSFRSGNRGLAQMDAPKGTLIVYATAPGDVAFDGDGENGLFTENLLRHIGTPNLDIELMFRQVRIDVLSQTEGKQTPWTSSSLRGSFSFNGEVEGGPGVSQGGQQVALVSPRRSWRRDLPEGTEMEDLRLGEDLIFRITTQGSSSAADAASRRILGQKAAMRNVSSALRKRLEFHDVRLSSSRLRSLESQGEMVDLVYLDDGKVVQLTYEIPIPTDIAASVEVNH